MFSAESSLPDLLDPTARALFDQAKELAAHHSQPLSSVHIVLASLGEGQDDSLKSLLDEHAVSALRTWLQGSLRRTNGHQVAGDGLLQELHHCLRKAQDEATKYGDTSLSPGMVLWAAVADEVSHAGVVFRALDVSNVLNVTAIISELHKRFERPSTSDSQALAMQLAEEHCTAVSPTHDNWFAETHSTLRNDVLNIFSRAGQYQNGAVPVIAGIPGTPIEHFDQVLADYLDLGSGMLATHRKVLRVNLDGVRRLVDVPGGTPELPYNFLHTKLKAAAQAHEVIILDHVEVLDPDRALTGDGRVERGLSALLSQPGDALVVALYRRESTRPMHPNGVKGLGNAKVIQLEGYTPSRARDTIFAHFVPHWLVAQNCVVQSDVFDFVFAMEPWVWIDGARNTLPYLAIMVGRDAIRSLIDGGEAEIKRLAEGALNHLKSLRSRAATVDGLNRYFADTFNQADIDLRGLLDSPVSRDRSGKYLLRRGHVTAQLLGAGSHEIQLPGSIPVQPPYSAPTSTAPASANSTRGTKNGNTFIDG